MNNFNMIRILMLIATWTFTKIGVNLIIKWKGPFQMIPKKIIKLLGIFIALILTYLNLPLNKLKTMIKELNWTINLPTTQIRLNQTEKHQNHPLYSPKANQICLNHCIPPQTQIKPSQKTFFFTFFRFWRSIKIDTDQTQSQYNRNIIYSINLRHIYIKNWVLTKEIF